jgi:peptidylprolyl isomerase
MTLKLSSLALLAAMTTAAIAQTTTTAKAPVTHHTATATPATNIPKVVGIPKTLYALKYIDTKIGTGPLAISSVLGTTQANSKIEWYTVHYTGWLTDGTKFDASLDHPGGEPITFPAGVRRVILGWDTGFQGMHVGGKRRLFIPYQLAYGETGKPPTIPAKSNLIFDIELVSQSDTPPQPKKPATPPTPPASPAAPATAPKPATDAAPPTTTPTPPSADKPATPPTAPQPQTPPHPETF